MAEWLNPKWVDIGLKLVEMLVVVVFAAYSWLNTRTKASQKAVEKLAELHRDDMLRLSAERRKDRRELEDRIEACHRQLGSHMKSLQRDFADQVETVETDLHTLTGQVQRLPEKDDIVRIHKRIDTLTSTTLGVEKQLQEVSRTVGLIQGFLISKGEK